MSRHHEDRRQSESELERREADDFARACEESRAYTRRVPSANDEFEQACAASRASTRHRASVAGEPQNEHLWHKIKEGARSGGSTSSGPIRPACPICDEDLSVAGYPKPNYSDQDRRPESHAAKIFPCGHTMCRGCTARLLAVELSESTPRVCPVCRANIECQECKLPVRLATAPSYKERVDKLERVPKTTAEGGEFKETCSPCRAQLEFQRMILGCPGMQPLDKAFVTYVWAAIDDARDHSREFSRKTVEAVFHRRLKEQFEPMVLRRDQFIDRKMATPEYADNDWY